ncbi:MAG: hypothetical protein OEZ65_11420 [Gemmatimonadota bacterium]|nr:hypothetical protein [Gemmatimonadota bacterium]
MNTSASWFRRLLLPGFVFQSVVIAGGYGTGRELVEFFLTQGPVGGLLALVASMVVFSLVCMATFEFARVFRAHDYRHFFRELLGPGWVVFEAAYVVLLLLILAVVAAASGSIAVETFGLPYAVGVAAVMMAVGALVFGGSALIERVFSVWSAVLYGVYLVFFAWCFHRFGGVMETVLTSEPAGSGWAWAGLRYAGYNLAVIPAVLVTVRHQTSRADSLVAGALAGPIAMIPGLLFYFAMVGQYPGILDDTVPANTLLEILGSRAFQIVFQVVLFGTLIETGTGLIHAVNERLFGDVEGEPRPAPSWARPAVGVGLLLAGAAVSRFGLINLIAKGYGQLTFVFIAVYVIPVLTWGVWKVRRR